MVILSFEVTGRWWAGKKVVLLFELTGEGGGKGGGNIQVTATLVGREKVVASFKSP